MDICCFLSPRRDPFGFAGDFYSVDLRTRFNMISVVVLPLFDLLSDENENGVAGIVGFFATPFFN